MNVETLAQYQVIFDLLLGAIMPPLIALLQDPHKPKSAKFALTVVVCTIVAVVKSFFAGQLDFTDIAQTMATIILAAVAVYEAKFKFTQANKTLQHVGYNGKSHDNF